MPTTTVLKPCLYYFVNLNALGVPIPETMMSKTNNKFDENMQCHQARVPTTQMSYEGQCFYKSHFRYFYKVSKKNGQILPNSMWQMVGKPKNMCSGTYNILEFVVYDTVNQQNNVLY